MRQYAMSDAQAADFFNYNFHHSFQREINDLSKARQKTPLRLEQSHGDEWRFFCGSAILHHLQKVPASKGMMLLSAKRDDHIDCDIITAEGDDAYEDGNKIHAFSICKEIILP